MKLEKISVLALTVLLCSISPIISMSQGSITSTALLNSDGLINDPEARHYHQVAFESPDDVRFLLPIGLSTQGQKYVFQSEHSAWTTSFADNVVDRIIPPKAIGVRPGSTGSYVLREWLTNASTENTRRIHIRHLWDPLTTSDIWMEGWVYFPADFPPSVGGWNEFWSMLTEREWNPSYVDAFAKVLSLDPTRRNSDGTTRIGTVLNFYWPSGSLYHDYPKIDLISKANSVLLGSWNHIKTHVHRPIDASDPTADDAGGYMEVWVANSVTNWQLVKQDWYELSGPNPGKHWGTTIYSRTVGEKPEILATFPATGNNIKGWLESGFDLYCDVGSSPRVIYFDDLVLSATDI